jgi:hypothetical protein
MGAIIPTYNVWLPKPKITRVKGSEFLYCLWAQMHKALCCASKKIRLYRISRSDCQSDLRTENMAEISAFVCGKRKKTEVYTRAQYISLVRKRTLKSCLAHDFALLRVILYKIKQKWTSCISVCMTFLCHFEGAIATEKSFPNRARFLPSVEMINLV